LIGTVLLGQSSRTRGLFDVEAVETDLKAGSWRDHAGIWRAFNAELWLRAFAPGPA
jgi:hypothetical protein